MNEGVILQTKNRECTLTEKTLSLTTKKGTAEYSLKEIAECHMEVHPYITGGIQLVLRFKNGKSIATRLPRVYSIWVTSLLATMQQTTYTQRWADAVNLQIAKMDDMVQAWKCSYCQTLNEAKEERCSHCGSPRRKQQT
jgi:uncharacterized paraquat-inducible protein A